MAFLGIQALGQVWVVALLARLHNTVATPDHIHALAVDALLGIQALGHVAAVAVLTGVHNPITAEA
jgi:hypothetical protein